MHKMKEEVILRILVQESLKSELRLRRYGEKNFRDLFVISGKWLGVFLEIFFNSRVPVGISVDCDLISDKCRGFFAKWWGISARGLFFNRKYHGGPGPQHVDRRRGSSPPWTEAACTRRCGGALPACGAWALGLIGAHRQSWRRTSRTRRCQRGAHQSMSGGEEAAQRRQRTVGA
jgi:hypothetical protein